MTRPIFASAAALVLAGTSLWAQGSFTTIDVPGAVSTSGPLGLDRIRINPLGQIVGGYFDVLGTRHGFLLSNGNFSTIDVPGALFTTLVDISPSGDIVGDYQDANLILHGFLLSNGNLTTIDVPGAVPATLQGQKVLTMVLGMSPEGDLGGIFGDSTGHIHGFVLSGGAFTQIDFPGSVFTSVMALKAGRIVGVEISGGRGHGYVLTNGVFSEFDFPGALATAPIDINVEGTIAGEYVASDFTTHGYKLEAGQFTTVDVPGAVLTFASGINPQGTMVGKYETPDGKFHGFELH